MHYPESQNIGSNPFGLLLVGHGTRDNEGLAEFAQTGQLVAKMIPHATVEAAFLELASPNIAAGIDRLVKLGLEQIVLAPVLLFAAGHAKRDLPTALQLAAARHPRCRFTTLEPLGCHPKLLQLSAQRFREAWVPVKTASPKPTLLVVGRGSLDAQATADMQHYAKMLADWLAIARHYVAFIAMAEPSLGSALDEISRESSGPLVVQPHLLFHGELLRELSARVAEFSCLHPDLCVQLAAHLGPSPLLAEALVEMVTGFDSLDKDCPLD